MTALLAGLFTMLLVLSSCNTAPKVEVVDETYDPGRDSLYAACAGITGFGPFSIDRMTFKDYLNSRDIKIDMLLRRSSFYGGHWSQGALEDSKTRSALSSYLEGKGFRQVEFASSSGPFTVGEIKFDKIDAVFWNDVLVAVYVDVAYGLPGNNMHKLLPHYIEKYGNGEGYKHYLSSSDWTEKRAREGRVSGVTDNTEERLWSNGKVSIQYHYRDYSKVIRGKVDTRSMVHTQYYLVSGARYDDFLKAIEAEVNAFSDSMQKKNSDALSAF